MALYLGLDCSTQGLSAIVLEIDDKNRRIVFQSSLNFDRDFPEYGTTGGVTRGRSEAEVLASPLMWADALDRMMSRIARTAELDLDDLRGIAGSAQQHGSVYLNRDAEAAWRALDPSRPLALQLAHTHSRAMSPVWMDATTSVECREIEVALGGADATSALTGSAACERFTGPQIRRYAKEQPAGYAATTRVHLVSSYLASLLAGRDMPIDPGDGSGMNLMDLEHNRWSPEALDATAPGLEQRLPPIQPSWDFAGRVSTYWQKRYTLPPAPILPWTGDNPSSLVGTGVIREGMLAVSLGTSDTVFSCTTEPARNASHVFRSPTGDFMNLVCFRNGSLTRERIRRDYQLEWADVGVILDQSPGNDGCLMLPWLDTEITPPIAHTGLRRFGFDRHDAAANVRGLIEGQMMAIANHTADVSATPIDRIIATGGAAVNRSILQVMANVFGVDVYRLGVENSAALGAALRAYHADRLASGEPVSWKTVVSGFTDPVPGHRVSPNPKLVAMYAELRNDYAIAERVHKHRSAIC